MNLATLIQRRELQWLVRAAILLAVVLGVANTFQGAVEQLAQQSWQFDFRWLPVAAGLYLVALLPMAWYWKHILRACGERPPWPATLRAYFLGHLGKYVPGKALVIVIRVAMLRPWITSLRAAAVSVVLETLTLMSVGALLAAVLAIFVLDLEPRLAMLAAAMAVLAGLPTLPPVARRLVRLLVRETPAELQSSDQSASSDTSTSEALQQAITARLLANGWIASVVCWTLQGLCLGAVVKSIGAESLPLPESLPLLVATVALAVVAGFLSMLPGGLVVRDALVMQLLVPVCGEGDALVAAVVLRLVSLLSELTICAILYVAGRIKNP